VILDVRDKEVHRMLLRRLDRYQIDPARVTLRGRVSVPEYFQAIGNVDIALDTIPYNGGTTTLDTLSMGVPVVAMYGDRGIARGTYSILQSLGAHDLIARDADEYIDINCRLARSPDWRNRLRATLRDRMRTSTLMDAAQFTADLESAYRRAWTEWCETVKPPARLQGKPSSES
jgi:predicted O-linked N-acetylglucosamine transferase (SPINDLY family)